jgi:hypothetical protein
VLGPFRTILGSASFDEVVVLRSEVVQSADCARTMASGGTI